MQKFKTNDVSDITLLSIEEAKKLPQEILACGEWWWLRSPGGSDYYAAYVSIFGSVYESGLIVLDGRGAVRPAFLVPKLKSSNLKIGDMIEVAGTESIVISDDMALAKEPVGYTAFRKDWEAKNANNYEKSDIKKWLKNWWNAQLTIDDTRKIETWIVSVGGYDGNTVTRVIGTEAQVRAHLISLIKEEREDAEDDYDYGTETAEDIKYEGKNLIAYAVFRDFHLDYCAVREDDVPTTKL